MTQSLAEQRGHRLPAQFIAFGVIASIILGVLTQNWLAGVRALGRFIPQANLVPDYALAVVWGLVLLLSIACWPASRRERLAIGGVWVIKLLVVLVLMLWYENNYEYLDAYSYFDVAQRPSFPWGDLTLTSGTLNIEALVRVIGRLTPHSYHGVKLSFAYIGLVAVFLFYRAAALVIGRSDLRVWFVLALCPSILFWSSILGKDPVVLLGVGCCAYGVMRWLRRGLGSSAIPICLGLLVAGMIRAWYIPILLAPLFVLLMRLRLNWFWRTTASVLCAAGFVAAVGLMRQQLAVETLSDVYSRSESITQAWAAGGSAQQIAVQLNSLSSLLAFLPRGVFTALFRPLPGEVANMYGLLAGLESAALLALVAVTVARMRWSALREPAVQWAAAYTLVWASIYGFISYQNLGTGVRFRLQVLPVLIASLLYLAFEAPNKLHATAPRVAR